MAKLILFLQILANPNKLYQLNTYIINIELKSLEMLVFVQIAYELANLLLFQCTTTSDTSYFYTFK